MFNYGSYFYHNNIFDIEEERDRKKFEKAVIDARKIEEYFSDMIPNREIIIPIILTSFRLNNNIECKDRINYIRGIIYSKKYIDFDDISKFVEDLQMFNVPTNNSIFLNKDYSESRFGFFYDAFDDNVGTDSINANEVLYYIIESDKFIKSNEVAVEDKEDEEENQNEVAVEDRKDEEENEEENAEEDVENSFDLMYYSISPKEKLELFKKNFEDYINIMLDKKNVDKRKNNRARVFIIKGMRDYFEFVMGILEEIYEMDEIQKNYYSLDLSKFL